MGKFVAKDPFQSHNFNNNRGELDVGIEQFGFNSSYPLEEEYRVIWEFMEPLLPETKKKYTTGRPRLKLRHVADGIFYVLRTGCQWKAVPQEFGSGSSLHDYFQSWVTIGAFWKLWQQGLLEYDELAGIKWNWQSIDGAITKSPLGGEKNWTKPNRQSETWNQEKPAYGWRRRSTIAGDLLSANLRQ